MSLRLPHLLSFKEGNFVLVALNHVEFILILLILHWDIEGLCFRNEINMLVSRNLKRFEYLLRLLKYDEVLLGIH
jgi:hypothetical protein